MLKRAALFSALAFVISWTLFYLTGALFPASASFVTSVVFMFGPLIASLLTAMVFDRGRLLGMLALRAGLSWWWLVAWLMPSLLAAIAMLMTSVLPGAQWVSSMEGIVALAVTVGVELGTDDIASLPPFWSWSCSPRHLAERSTCYSQWAKRRVGAATFGRCCARWDFGRPAVSSASFGDFGTVH